MALFDTNLVISAAPLDPAFNGNLQDFADHFVRRLLIQSPTGLYTVIVADVAPLSNQGLLLLGGTKLYVWDENVAGYVPADITDSLGVEPTGKYVFTSNNGTLNWETAAGFLAWLGFAVGNIPAGPAGTIVYSNGVATAFGTPGVALPDGSVPVGKLEAEVADAGKKPVVQSDGTVAWQSDSALSSQTAASSEYAMPAKGTSLSITRPSGAQLLRVVAVCQVNDAGRTVGEEVDIHSFDESAGSGSRVRAFSLETTTANSWRVARSRDWGVSGGTELIDLAGGFPIEITDASWKLKAYYLP